MPVAAKINSLRGETITRDTVKALMMEAKEEEQDHLYKKMLLLLRSNPGQKLFVIAEDTHAIEHTPESLLHGLHCEHDTDGTIQGLGKAVSADAIYQMITDRMIEMVKAASDKDYRHTWKKRGYLIPFNFASKKRYRGINTVLLTEFELLQNPFFLTFKQVEELGGKVKKGSAGSMVVYFTYLYRYEAGSFEIVTYDYEQFIAELAKIGVSDPEKEARKNRIPVLKYYKVFNGTQITGIDWDLDNFKIGYIETEVPANEDNRLPIAESIISYYPAPAPKIFHGGNDAFYNPGSDSIHLPDFADFITAQDYYRTAFHELAHSTGAKKRLDRVFGKKFGDKEYAFEELVAEFCATFTTAEAGIIWHSNSNHAAYLKNWNSALTHMASDTRFLMRAASAAQEAADYILQPDKDGVPKYLKELQRKQKAQEKKVSAKKNDDDFVLDTLPEKFEKSIYNSAEAELKGYTTYTDATLATAAKNMLWLIDNKLFVLLDFKEGYGRNSKKQEYRNVPTVYRKLTAKEVAQLPIKVLRYLLAKTKEYEYETAWLDYSFAGLSVFDIAKVVKANIRTLEKEIAKYQPGQLELALNGKKGLGTPATPEPVDYDEPEPMEEDQFTAQEPQPQPEPCTPDTINIEEAETEPVQAVKYYEPEDNEPVAAGGMKLGLAPSGDAVFFNIGGETKKFLQRVERKPRHSVVITVDGEQGAGKTSMIYQWMQDFADPGNRCMFLSMEEHPECALSVEKAEKFLSPCPHPRIDAYEGVNSKEHLYELIAKYDIIFIDSWQKLVRKLGKTFMLDEDLRQAVDGKAFIIIFQQTTEGKTKGGADVVFDGDIITKMHKGEKFSDNYAFFDKNRYTLVPLEQIRYNIAEGRCYNPETETDTEPEQQAPQPLPVKRDISAELAKLNFKL